MPERIFIAPDQANASVIKLGDECYQREGDSKNAPTISDIDEEFDSCEDCEGDSSSSSSSGSCCIDSSGCEYSDNSTVAYSEEFRCPAGATPSNPTGGYMVSATLKYQSCGVWSGPLNDNPTVTITGRKTSDGWRRSGIFNAVSWSGTGSFIESDGVGLYEFIFSTGCNGGNYKGEPADVPNPRDDCDGYYFEIDFQVLGNDGCDSGGLP